MKEKLKIIWAHIRCEVYLLFIGMWRRETKFQGWTPKGLAFIASATGQLNLTCSNIKEGTRDLKVKKIFYENKAMFKTKN